MQHGYSRGVAVALAIGTVATGCLRRTPPVVRAIQIVNLRFEPQTLVASPGDTIVWTNRDVVPHTVRMEGGRDSGELGRSENFTFVVGDVTVDYICSYHPTMNGRIEVR